MKRTGPIGKIARRLNVALTPKCVKILEKRPTPPGQHGKQRRGAPSNFGKQLLEKQRLKFQYMITERALSRYYDNAISMKGSTGTNLLNLLEHRLDVVITRSGLTPTVVAARQLVNHGHVLVNGRKAAKPGLHVTPEDHIELTAKAKKISIFAERAKEDIIPLPYVDIDRANFSVRWLREPERTEIPIICEEHLVVEWYSR